MSDLMQSGLSAVTLLAPVLPFIVKSGEKFAEKIGEASYNKVRALYESIRNKFDSDQDQYALQSLQRLEEQPADESRQAVVASVINEKAQTDLKFADELERRIREAKGDTSLSQFITNVSGNAQVGKILNIGQAGNITIDES